MRPEKLALVKEIEARFDSSEFAVAVDYQGMTVEKLGALRGALRECDSRMDVYKNTFLTHVIRQRGLDGLDEILQGPTAVVFGSGDVTEVAKALKKFKKANERPVVKGGILGREVLSATDVEALAEIPPREIMLGMLLGTMAAPMTQLVGVMQQKVLSLLYCLKAIEDKRQKGE